MRWFGSEYMNKCTCGEIDILALVGVWACADSVLFLTQVCSLCNAAGTQRADQRRCMAPRALSHAQYPLQISSAAAAAAAVGIPEMVSSSGGWSHSQSWERHVVQTGGWGGTHCLWTVGGNTSPAQRGYCYLA